MPILDDLKLITNRDGSDALGVATKQFNQLKQRFETSGSSQKPANVIVAGMGGSALAAQLISSWPKLDVPYEVVRDYSLPSYVNNETLFIASSYSGNTEETLSALKHAEKAEAVIVVITSGGQLLEIAKQKGYPICKLTVGLQPRMSMLGNFKALLSIFVHYQIASGEALDQVERLADELEDLPKTWAADVASQNNLAKQLAEKILGKTPIIYAGPELYPIAYQWKISFNETSKNTAWSNFYSEFDHNEFLGWTSHPIEKPFAPINLISSFEHSQILKRFALSDRLLSGKWPQAININLQGKNLLEQMMWAKVLGDMTSIYLAILNGVDPTKINLIEKLKKELS